MDGAPAPKAAPVLEDEAALEEDAAPAPEEEVAPVPEVAPALEDEAAQEMDAAPAPEAMPVEAALEE